MSLSCETVNVSEINYSPAKTIIFLDDEGGGYSNNTGPREAGETGWLKSRAGEQIWL